MTMTEKQKKILVMLPILILVYLGSTLLLYDLIVEPQVNKITAKVVSTVNITPALESTCNFSVYEGRNLVSFHCVHNQFPTTFVLANFTGNYEGIFGYTNDINDPWKSYNENLPIWAIQDLNWITDYKGYWLIANKNTTFYLEGFFNTNTQAQLHQGWNLIGYPRETPNTPAVTYNSLSGNYNIVLKYAAVNDTWYYYSPGDPNSTLTMIDLDYGYWINMSTTDMWVYP